MKALILTGAMTLGIGTACFADGLYWVVGNSATKQCEIVTSNPIVIGDISFGDGPYRSLDDANLARSTISFCPKEDPPAEQSPSKPDSG
jgi:hypothetical protein